MVKPKTLKYKKKYNKRFTNKRKNNKFRHTKKIYKKKRHTTLKHKKIQRGGVYTLLPDTFTHDPRKVDNARRVVRDQVRGLQNYRETTSTLPYSMEDTYQQAIEIDKFKKEIKKEISQKFPDGIPQDIKDDLDNIIPAMEYEIFVNAKDILEQKVNAALEEREKNEEYKKNQDLAPAAANDSTYMFPWLNSLIPNLSTEQLEWLNKMIASLIRKRREGGET